MTSASRNKNWFSAAVETVPEAIEAVEFALLESGAAGTETSTIGKDKNAETLPVIGYFNEQCDLRDKLSEALEIYRLPAHAVKSVRWQKVEERDWLAEWKKGWQPVQSGRFIVAPTWSDLSNTQDKITIRIEPGMAFGTGTHETTRLCLAAIDRYFTGGSFLDVGTGTAVLAIAAAKMFPETWIEACDTDADSVKIARENAALNGAAGKIKFYEGSITADTRQFELVCANLTANVIIPLLPLLLEKSAETLILSGILAEQKEPVVNELVKLGRSSFDVQQSGEWISIVVNKRN